MKKSKRKKCGYCETLVEEKDFNNGLCWACNFDLEELSCIVCEYNKRKNKK